MQFWIGLAVFAAIIAGAAAIRQSGVNASNAQHEARNMDLQKKREANNRDWADLNRADNEKAAEEIAKSTAEAKRNAALLAIERAKNVPNSANAACVLNLGSVQHINAAAAGLPGVPNAGSRTNDRAAGIKLDQLVDSVAGNYAGCREDAARFRKLVDRIRAICREYNRRYGHPAAGCDPVAGTTPGERPRVN